MASVELARIISCLVSCFSQLFSNFRRKSKIYNNKKSNILEIRRTFGN